MSLEGRFRQAWELFLSPEAKFASIAKKEAGFLDGALNFALGFICVSAAFFFLAYFFPADLGYAIFGPHLVTAIAFAFIVFLTLFVFNLIFMGLFHLILKIFGSKSSFASFYYLFSLIALWSFPLSSIFLATFIISELIGVLGLIGTLLGALIEIAVMVALYTIAIYHLYQSVLAAKTASGVSSLKTVFSMVLAFSILFGLLFLLFLLVGVALLGS
ncbi:MAG: YIP1 family protein [Candidatus Anstonellaceae archaeon]